MPRHSPYALYSLNFQLVLYKLLCYLLLEFRSIIFFFGLLLLSIREKVLSFLLFFELLPPWLDFRLVLANCSYPRFFRKTILYWINLNLLKTVFLNYLFVITLSCFIRFSMNICFDLHPYKQCVSQTTILSLTSARFYGPALALVVGSNGLEPSTSRLSGARSNHLSYEPI